MRKYFKYAFGEILLVVIGILIALQINNWNEERKRKITEVQYLKSFKQDLLANKDELNRIIEKSQFTSNSADSILRFKRGELEYFNLESFVFCMMNGTGFTVFQSREGTVQDIMGSGNLDVIKNDSIRMAIGSWQANLKSIREWENLDKTSYASYNEYLHRHIQLYRRYEAMLPVNETKMTELLSDDVFLNRISDRKRIPGISNQNYSKLIPKLDRLIKQIDDELRR